MANCLYNGIELPALPSIDAAYPYVVIVHSTFGSANSWCIQAMMSPVYFDLDGQSACYLDDSHTSHVNYSLNDTSDGWKSPSVHADSGSDCAVLGDAIKWTNTDIRNSDGSMYLAASTPIPVGGSIPEQTFLGMLLAQFGVIPHVMGKGGFKEATMYSYNGVILPKLPAVEGYPYAVIIDQTLGGQGYCWLTISSVAFIHGKPNTWGSAVLWGVEDGVKKLYRCGVEEDTWHLYEDGEIDIYIDSPSLEEAAGADTVNVGSGGRVLWCNNTITYADGTISCAASDPIPVYE